MAATLLASSTAVGVHLVARGTTPATAPDEDLATVLRVEHARHVTLCGLEMPPIETWTECDLGDRLMVGCRIDDSSHAGISQARLTGAVERQRSALHGCMQSRDERRELDRDPVHALVHIERDGRIGSFIFKMVGDTEAETCLGAALRDLRFPATDARTRALLTIEYTDLETTVTATRKGVVRRM